MAIAISSVAAAATVRILLILILILLLTLDCPSLALPVLLELTFLVDELIRAEHPSAVQGVLHDELARVDGIRHRVRGCLAQMSLRLSAMLEADGVI